MKPLSFLLLSVSAQVLGPARVGLKASHASLESALEKRRKKTTVLALGLASHSAHSSNDCVGRIYLHFFHSVTRSNLIYGNSNGDLFNMTSAYSTSTSALLCMSSLLAVLSMLPLSSSTMKLRQGQTHEHDSGKIIHLNEDNWRVTLKGEWMILL